MVKVLHRILTITQEGVIFKWTHVADNSMRIDPSISNVHEMFLLTDTYYDKVQSYPNVSWYSMVQELLHPELENEFAVLEEFKPQVTYNYYLRVVDPNYYPVMMSKILTSKI